MIIASSYFSKTNLTIDDSENENDRAIALIELERLLRYAFV